MISFGARIAEAIDEHGALCVGIDPHEHLLTAWGLDASASGAREFGLRVVEAAAGRAGVVKPQVSFFERWGSAGYSALEDVLAAARAAGLIVIADAKRGDIGTTMDAYARAWLTPGSPLEVDALTVNPYLGVGALAEAIDLAYAHGKGLFVLAATSNPQALGLQTAVAPSGATVAGEVIADASLENGARRNGDEWGSIGFVIGATVERRVLGVPDELTPPAPILAPGFGTQGARLVDLPTIFGALAPYVLASESRGILSAGPDGIADAISTRTAELETHARG